MCQVQQVCSVSKETAALTPKAMNSEPGMLLKSTGKERGDRADKVIKIQGEADVILSHSHEIQPISMVNTFFWICPIAYWSVNQ